MEQKFSTSRFARFYVWMTKAKSTMGLFFVAFVFIYLLFGLINEGLTVTLDFFTAIEMIFACFFIGLCQQILLPGEKLTKMRCTLWILIGAAITLSFSLVFHWFARFPLWCVFLFAAIVAIGMMAMIVSYNLELRRETRRLNKRLEQFQKRNIPNNGKDQEMGETII